MARPASLPLPCLFFIPCSPLLLVSSPAAAAHLLDLSAYAVDRLVQRTACGVVQGPAATKSPPAKRPMIPSDEVGSMGLEHRYSLGVCRASIHWDKKSRRGPVKTGFQEVVPAAPWPYQWAGCFIWKTQVVKTTPHARPFGALAMQCTFSTGRWAEVKRTF
jgi:hypothetical protein